MCLTRLLYYSENAMGAVKGTVLAGLRDIHALSIKNNQAVGITGSLIFDDHWFFQALEGERAAVWTTLRRIEDDERHANVVVVEAREADDRLFGNWWMGLATRNPQTAAIFAPYLRNGVLQPQQMAATSILDLMTALCRTGSSKRAVA